MSTFDDFAEELHDQTLDPAVQQAHLAYLRALPNDEPAVPAANQRRRHRGLVVIGISTAIVLAAGGGTAAALGLFGRAPTADTSSAFCYATTNLDDESVNNRTEFALGDGQTQELGDAAAAGLDICAIYWRSGLFTIGGATNPDVLPTGGTQEVPPLVACVLPNGQAGIFPGDTTTCENLGLSTLAP